MSKDAHIHGEEAIIQEFLAPLAAGYAGAFGLQDDCAAIAPTPGHDLIVKTDPIAEGVHFSAGDRPEDIGWKALAVNVSDLAAKAAIPRAYLMAMSFPDAPARDWMQRFAQGLREAQTAFGMHLIGGDTDRRPGPITISITVFGEVPSGKMIRRGAAKPGDMLYVTGFLGTAAIGLALKKEPALAEQWLLSDSQVAEAIAHLHRPEPRLAAREALLACASAAMDISDGLAKDLGRMCKASGCGARVRIWDVPRDVAADKAVKFDPAHWQDVLAAGDDYELLIAVPPQGAAEFEQRVRACRQGGPTAQPFAVTRIGEMASGSAVELLDADGKPLQLRSTGWEHF